MLLLQATIFVTLFAIAVTLWMGFYLLARGFPSRMTLRVVQPCCVIRCLRGGCTQPRNHGTALYLGGDISPHSP